MREYRYNEDKQKRRKMKVRENYVRRKEIVEQNKNYREVWEEAENIHEDIQEQKNCVQHPVNNERAGESTGTELKNSNARVCPITDKTPVESIEKFE